MRFQVIVVIINFLVININVRVRTRHPPSLLTARLVVHILNVLFHLVFPPFEAATLAFLEGMLRSLATTYRAEEFKNLGGVRVGEMTSEVCLPSESETGTFGIRALELARGEDVTGNAF